MLKLIRAVFLISAIYLYFIFIIKDSTIASSVTKILLVTLLLITMEVIRKRSNNTFKEYSSLETIDIMNHQTFANYIAELYKRLGYTVTAPKDTEKNLCELVLYNAKAKYYVKCFNQLNNLDNIDLENIDKLYSGIKKTKIIFFTNAHCTDEVRQMLSKYKITVNDRKFLMNSLEKIQLLGSNEVLRLNTAKQ